MFNKDLIVTILLFLLIGIFIHYFIKYVGELISPYIPKFSDFDAMLIIYLLITLSIISIFIDK